MEKTCFKCDERKPLDEFYKHSQMGDGHLNKCKECTKRDVHGHRQENIERIREYDRARGNRQDASYLSEYRRRYPNKHRAHTIVNNAVRDSRLFKEHCSVCGGRERIHAHHDDYAKPLNVRWLCAAHHKQWHAEHGEAKNP
jgi:hypothetical protein